ncbi:hypothetical protein V144x_10530 [Gimesia aquarii]|uniref:Uncharacterized protein n=1 Tax=Gimesia aquarii TaxID=2527964 RepID=A0A517VRG5_9PLAN|nr:hypothetical protein V144x_10530 [Gimesia aquarii]
MNKNSHTLGIIFRTAEIFTVAESTFDNLTLASHFEERAFFIFVTVCQ